MAQAATSWVDALQRYVDGLAVASVAAAENATRMFQRRVQERAREHEQWSQLADNISVWSQDGHLVVGIADQDLVPLAHLLEYGDPDQAPNPLFRTLTNEAHITHQQMRSEMESQFGPAMDVGAIRIQGMRYGR